MQSNRKLRECLARIFFFFKEDYIIKRFKSWNTKYTFYYEPQVYDAEGGRGGTLPEISGRK